MTLDQPNRLQNLVTRAGTISFPAYIPVTTFGDRYPLDDLIRPYLPRLATAIMISLHYAQQMKPEERPWLPLMVDSGGFAAFFENSQVLERDGLGVLQVTTADGIEILDPETVLRFQESIADVAFTLDFPAPATASPEEVERRANLTVENAIWALNNRHRADLPLYAVLPVCEVLKYQRCAFAYRELGFDGVAIGGMVPYAKDHKRVIETVAMVRSILGDKIPIHVLGMGNPKLVPQLFAAGADSVDSSSYVQTAASGTLWRNPSFKLESPSSTDRMNWAIDNLKFAIEQCHV